MSVKLHHTTIKEKIALHTVTEKGAVGIYDLKEKEIVLPLMINFPFFLLPKQEKIQTLQLLFFNPMCLLVCDAQLVLVRQAVSALQQTHESEIELDAC